MLNAMLIRQNKSCKAGDSCEPGSHTNLGFLRTPQRKERYKRLRKESKACKEKIKRLEKRIQEAIMERGIEVDENYTQTSLSG